MNVLVIANLVKMVSVLTARARVVLVQIAIVNLSSVRVNSNLLELSLNMS